MNKDFEFGQRWQGIERFRGNTHDFEHIYRTCGNAICLAFAARRVNGWIHDARRLPALLDGFTFHGLLLTALDEPGWGFMREPAQIP